MTVPSGSVASGVPLLSFVSEEDEDDPEVELEEGTGVEEGWLPPLPLPLWLELLPPPSPPVEEGSSEPLPFELLGCFSPLDSVFVGGLPLEVCCATPPSPAMWGLPRIGKRSRGREM